MKKGIKTRKELLQERICKLENKIKEVYERCTKMRVPPRWPYAGELVFTAFSGSHQDAINKGKIYMDDTHSDMWEVPYLPIDPADVGREYEPIIRINSQSGKGGTAFILANNYGIKMPKPMHPEFGAVVQKACDEKGKELTSEEVFDLFQKELYCVGLVLFCAAGH